jgi:hypothetical protein
VHLHKQLRRASSKHHHHKSVCTSIEPTIIWVWKTRSKWTNYIEERERESVCVCPQPAHYVGPWLVQGYPKGFHWRESRTEGIVAFWAPSKYRGTFGSSLMSCPCCWRCQTNRVCTQLYGHSKWTRQKCPPNTISHFMHVSHNKYNLSFLECMQLYLKKIQFSFPSFNSKLIKFNHHQILY